MPHKQLVIFDLDDTLIDTSHVYWQARSAFVKKIKAEFTAEGIDEETIIDEFEIIDSINIKSLGFAPSRYEKSMLVTYQHLIEKHGTKPSSSSDEIISYIKACGRIILENMPEPINGAKDVLEWASHHFKLAVLSRGEESLQKQKLSNAGLSDYFDIIRVVPEKNAKIFKQVLEDAGYESRNTWVIGDSIKSDINPGIEVGAICILYVYRHHSYYWRQEHGCSSVGFFYKTHSLQEVRKILESPSAFEMVIEP